MSDIAVRVEGISKKYYIGKQKKAYNTFRDTLADSFLKPFRRAGKLLRGQATGAAELDEIIWALLEVAFEIKRGEVVGIIGGNGAGKSTLLKILSRITEPTLGFAEINGRIGSLLEVGTGFHPELTGRENTYLNGAILGMKRKEIDEKFDEIIAFSGVEKFIDTPVKHYSSGMYLRLAFAVAAHLEPEILIIDEVLAVGDVRFQRKCIDKMHEVGKAGRTVIFVSHNLEAISRLCERVILLEKGKILKDGASQKVISAYLNAGRQLTTEYVWSDINDAPGDDAVRLIAVRVKRENGEVEENTIDICETIGIEIEYEVLKAERSLAPVFSFRNQEGVLAFSTIDQDPDWRNCSRKIGRYVSTAWIPGNLLSEGRMTVAVVFVNIELKKILIPQREVIAFQIIDRYDGHSARGNWSGKMPGVVRPLLKWTTQYTSR